MGIVELDDDLVGEVVQCPVDLEMIVDDRLQARGNEEILLLDT